MLINQRWVQTFIQITDSHPKLGYKYFIVLIYLLEYFKMHFSAQSPALCPSLLPGGAPLGAARHARAKHARGEAGAHVDTRGQLGPGALPAAAAAGDGVAVAVVVAGERPRLLGLGAGC